MASEQIRTTISKTLCYIVGLADVTRELTQSQLSLKSYVNEIDQKYADQLQNVQEDIKHNKEESDNIAKLIVNNRVDVDHHIKEIRDDLDSYYRHYQIFKEGTRKRTNLLLAISIFSAIPALATYIQWIIALFQ